MFNGKNKTKEVGKNTKGVGGEYHMYGGSPAHGAVPWRFASQRQRKGYTLQHMEGRG